MTDWRPYKARIFRSPENAYLLPNGTGRRSTTPVLSMTAHKPPSARAVLG